MQNQDYTTSTDFLKRFFGETLQDIELRACSNDRSSGAVSVFGRDTASMAAFLAKRDVSGTGMYFGLCTRAEVRKDDGNRSGAKDAVAECPALWVDIDCAKQGISGDDAIAALEFLPHPPTIIVNSGGGLHAYWLLEEAVDVTPGQPVRDTIEAALRQLALILAGDTQCAELARILRLPGTMNSKDATRALNDGAPVLCEVLSDTGRVHDLESLCEWLDEQRPILHGKVQEARPVRSDDPFVAYAREAGYEPAIDIDAELAAMNHEGSGETSIHRTQIRVAYSMIARGYDDEEIVSRILAATEAAAPRDKQWNWNREEQAIRRDIVRSRSKQGSSKQDRPTPAQPLRVEGNAAVAIVHDMEEERAKREKPAAAPKEAKNEIAILGGATLAAWRQRYGPIIHGNGGSFVYEDGVWSSWEEPHDQMLRALLQEGCARLNMKPGTSLLNAASRWVMDHPELLIRDPQFDRMPLIVAGDAVLEIETLEVKPHSPDHLAMFKVGANLEGPRECGTFLEFLEESFSDRSADEVPSIISTLQEWFGASLVANKPRALRKGLLVHGGSRTGKTQISEILRALLGRGQTSAMKVRDLEKDFGTQTLLGKRGWIADDAVGQGETLDAEMYKVIVTGEAMSIRRKNRSNIDGMRFGFPVCFTMNNLPKIKDGSDAVYNRSLVLPMTNVRPETAPEPRGYDSIAEKIIAEELTGVLWWAIDGWRRLAARGMFTPPKCMTEAVQTLQEMNDPVGTWVRQCTIGTTDWRVSPADLFASFSGWFFQENGDTKFGWSQNGFSRRLKERLPGLEPHRESKQRWLIGVKLNEDGLEYWSVNADRDSLRRTTADSIDVGAVNRFYDRTEEPPAPKPGDRRPRF